MSQITPTTSPILHGRYRIEEQLGAGRLVVVYRAYDERLQRKVLVHMLRKELVGQATLRQRFIQEAHDSARRSHQSLLEVYDSGEVAGRPYMITEYVAGRSLRELGMLLPEDALLYFRQVVGAVAACEAAHVPHPPISSNNIILVEDGHVELLESWLMPAAQISLDNASYRAPERTAGSPASPASTVYALGLLLFEMLTGQRAITGDDPRAVAQAHLTARIPVLTEIRPLLYLPSLERLLQRATARRPEQRPANAAALGREFDDLRREITGDTRRLTTPPVQPPSLRERINRTANDLVAPRPTPRPAPAAERPAVKQPPQPSRQPAQPRNDRRRSIIGITILLSLILVVACGSYYGVSLLIDRVANIELPRPTVDLPTLPELGITLPEWITGVISGQGQVLVVSGVSDEGLNLRNAPGLNTDIVAQLPNGTRIRKLDGPRTVDNVPWMLVQVKLNDQDLEGWVSANFVKPE
jgi:eukaryotic-like serine/threonine-protein kinase